jgi:lipopolysaccharide export system permease protein
MSVVRELPGRVAQTLPHLERYVMVEVLKPLGAVLGILTALFACYSGARYLADAVTETLGVVLMLRLIALKTLIALEVLVPVAFYASIIIGLGRLHRDQEIVAMRAAGVSGLRIVRAVFLLAVPVGLAVALLSLYARPWAYHTSYLIDSRATAELNTDRFQAGRFYGNEDSGRVIYIGARESDSGEMKSVFQYIRHGGQSRIIIARRAHKEDAAGNDRAWLDLRDGVMYRLSDSGDTVVHFGRLSMFLDVAAETLGYKRKAAMTAELLHSDRLQDVAELQWRVSRPFATVLLALIAVPLSRASPRHGRREMTFTAALVFAVYYNLSGLAQTWVEHGTVGSFPGVWWLPALMTAAVAGLLLPEYRHYLEQPR